MVTMKGPGGLALLMLVVAVWLPAAHAISPAIAAAIAERSLLISSRTEEHRTAGCTSAFKPTYVRPGSSLNFRSQLKANLKEKMRECGWLFWTDPGTRLSVTCDVMNLLEGEYFILFDSDYAQDHGIRGPSVAPTAVAEDFRSSNVYVGLQSKFGREDRAFECSMTAEPDLQDSALILGGRVKTQGWGKLLNFKAIYGTLNATVPLLDNDPYDAGMAMREGILYVCGGTVSRACVTLDVNVANAAYVSLTDDIGIPVNDPTVYAFKDKLWVLQAKKLIELGLDGTKLATHDLTVFPEDTRCGAGNDHYRFITLKHTGGVYYNKDNSDPTSWTLLGDLPDGLKFDGGCYLYKGKFYIAGTQEPIDDIFSTRNFVVDTTQGFALTEMPKLNDKRVRTGMGILDGKLAVIGGVTREGPVFTFFNDAELYDEETETWSIKPNVLNETASFLGFLPTPFDL